MYHRVVIVVLGLFLVSAAQAAPPVDGTPTLETRVKQGCKFAGVVVVARIVNLRSKLRAGGELQTGDVEVIELIKGVRSEVPASVITFKSIPPMTDSLWRTDLENQMTYLMFLNAPTAPVWESRIPMLQYDPQSNNNTNREYLAAVSMAKTACHP